MNPRSIRLLALALFAPSALVVFTSRAHADTPPTEPLPTLPTGTAPTSTSAPSETAAPLPSETSTFPTAPSVEPPGVTKPRPPHRRPPTSNAPSRPSGWSTAREEPQAMRREKPLAGYSAADGKFFLRDEDDSFLLLPGGRLQIDTYGYAGKGVSDYQRSTNGTGLKDDLFLKRGRVELGGRILKNWYFWLGGDFALGGGVDASQKVANNAAPADMFIGYVFGPELRVQVGQFDTPFTMENLTSDKWLPFMERSLTVRGVGSPYNKDLGIMARGEALGAHLGYALAYVGGEGQNRPSLDNRGDVMGRLIFRPLAGEHDSVAQRMHIGVSGRWGRRDPSYVKYDAPALSTPGGYTFWNPVYGTGATETHVIPSGDQTAIAAEVFVPFGRFDVEAEGVLVKEGRRESFASSIYNVERAGSLTGGSYYVQVAYWPFGQPRISGEPATYPDPSMSKGTAKKRRTREGEEHPCSLQLIARWEQMLLTYDSIARYPDVPGVTRGGLDGNTTRIRVNAIQVAGTLWATRHVRLTAEWSAYDFPGTAATNQVGAPGTKANAKDAGAHWFHEVSARVAVAL